MFPPFLACRMVVSVCIKEEGLRGPPRAKLLDEKTFPDKDKHFKVVVALFLKGYKALKQADDWGGGGYDWD